MSTNGLLARPLNKPAGLREYGRHVRFQARVPVDRRQFAKLLAQHDPHLYPGRCVTCVHDPDWALCHTGTQQGPSLGDCQSLVCRNVALTADNRTVVPSSWASSVH